MARTTIQNDASTNKVSKLSYQVRGPFRIVKYTGRGNIWFEIYANVIVQTSSSWRQISILFLLLWNRANLLIFSKSLNMELYNETWFDKPPWTSQP